MSADSLGCFGSKLKNNLPPHRPTRARIPPLPACPRLRRQLLPQPQRHVLRALPAQQRCRRILPHQKQIPHSLRHPPIKRLLHRHPRQWSPTPRPIILTPGWDHDLTIAPDGSKYHIKDVPSYGTSTTTGITHAKKANKPFFLNINISDPHQPFWKPGGSNKASRFKNLQSRRGPHPRLPLRPPQGPRRTRPLLFLGPTS